MAKLIAAQGASRNNSMAVTRTIKADAVSKSDDFDTASFIRYMVRLLFCGYNFKFCKTNLTAFVAFATEGGIMTHCESH